MVLVVLYLCNMSTRRDMNRTWWVRPWATQRRSQSQGFASNLVQELREEEERSFHNFFRSLQDDILKITTTRPLCARNFRIFFDKFSLSTRTDEQILQCDNFFLAKCTCSKAIMLAFEQVHLSRKKMTNSSLVVGDRGAGARENRGREGYGRRERKGREAGVLRGRAAGEKYETLIFLIQQCVRILSKTRTQNIRANYNAGLD